MNTSKQIRAFRVVMAVTREMREGDVIVTACACVCARVMCAGSCMCVFVHARVYTCTHCFRGCGQRSLFEEMTFELRSDW